MPGCSIFSVLLVQLSRETREQRWSQFWASLFCLDWCWTRASETWNIVFYPSLCQCRSGTEFVLNHDRLCHICCSVICAQIERCSQVFPWRPQNRFKSCPFVSPSGQVLRLFASIRMSFVGFFSWWFEISAYSGKQCDIVSGTSGDLSPSCVCCL